MPIYRDKPTVKFQQIGWQRIANALAESVASCAQLTEAFISPVVRIRVEVAPLHRDWERATTLATLVRPASQSHKLKTYLHWTMSFAVAFQPLSMCPSERAYFGPDA